MKVWHLSVPALPSREILRGMEGAVVITRDLDLEDEELLGDMVRIGVGGSPGWRAPSGAGELVA